jgi:pyruvate ferredoxin oxidoreductase gamma subunit
VTSSQLIAVAAFIDGKESQAFPMFGVERRGAPVQSFARISEEKIDVRQQVYRPDYVIVLDPTLMANVKVTEGLKDKGMIIVNTDKRPEELGLTGSFTVKTVDATELALKVLGKPFVNTAILGAFAAFTGEVSLEGLKQAVIERFEGKAAVAEKNQALVETVYNECEKD